MSERAKRIYELVVPPKTTIEPQGLNPTLDSDVNSSPAPELSPDLLDVAKDLGLISSPEYEEGG
ncbi:uncharacterized protein LOC111054757 [Nilaparvata lugens]|uniref:uncharacterized protein LOC111054757 n=1 Tax=Nilaparvata lugens TaxID=108931 RepID=UPI00193DD9F7|nr:uncharacterized protein LOC111054757 [Nilaparvata lugens]